MGLDLTLVGQMRVVIATPISNSRRGRTDDDPVELRH